MDISNVAKPVHSSPDLGQIAAEGLREQIGRLDRNVDSIAKQSTGQFSDSSKPFALVEQQEIVHAVRANAKSLQVSNQVVGTLLDLKV